MQGNHPGRPNKQKKALWPEKPSKLPLLQKEFNSGNYDVIFGFAEKQRKEIQANRPGRPKNKKKTHWPEKPPNCYFCNKNST